MSAFTLLAAMMFGALSPVAIVYPLLLSFGSSYAKRLAVFSGLSGLVGCGGMMGYLYVAIQLLQR